MSRHRAGRHRRRGAGAFTHWLRVNLTELRYQLTHHAASAVWLGLFLLFTLTG